MSSSSEEEEFLDIEDISNGLVLANIFLPKEVIINLLVFVSWKDLMSCRLVCQSWRRIIDSVVCYEKLKIFSYEALNESFTGPLSKLKSDSVPFYVYFGISNGIFGKNLVKNGFGSGDQRHVCRPAQNSWRGNLRRRMYVNLSLCSDANCPKYMHWGVLASGGHGWRVEAEPCGSEALPAHLPERSCFVTSFQWCRMEQLITLADCGFGSQMMDKVQPQFDVSEWYARRWDCRIKYKLHVVLFGSKKEIIQEFEEERGENLVDNKWHEISHTFKDYGPGVRHIKFMHAGTDGQFWRGHYGSKIAGGSVIARIPSSRFERLCDSSLAN